MNRLEKREEEEDKELGSMLLSWRWDDRPGVPFFSFFLVFFGLDRKGFRYNGWRRRWDDTRWDEIPLARRRCALLFSFFL